MPSNNGSHFDNFSYPCDNANSDDGVLRRSAALRKIRYAKLVSGGAKFNRETSVGYILGGYDYTNDVYAYWYAGTWVASLGYMIPVSDPSMLPTLKSSKIVRYSVSKVFYTTCQVADEELRAKYQIDPMKGFICNIRLTNPNHWQKLSAIMEI